MANQWKCPSCGSVLQKPDYWQAMPFAVITGTVRCGGCGAAFGAGEIKSGKYDVGGWGSAGSGSSKEAKPGEVAAGCTIALVFVVAIVGMGIGIWWGPLGHFSTWLKVMMSVVAVIIALGVAVGLGTVAERIAERFSG